jgi:uncharacterized protein YaaN involved in tellurite resistance
MSQLPVPASAGFQAAVPAEPQSSKEVTELSALSITPEKRDQLSCQRLLVGDTLIRARQEAADVLPKMLGNTQVLAVFGTDALEDVNRLNDRMLSERPPVNVPELHEVMKNLSRNMRGLGKRYDPNDPKVLEKYEKVKGGILSRLGFVKTFFEEFLDDIRSLQDQFERVVDKLEGKQEQLLRNVAYYDEFYRLNEQEIEKLIYSIGVMEIIRDMAAQQAKSIQIGDSTMGDRGSEQQAKILELVTLMDNKIAAWKGRLWVAWAMAPQIRHMRAISVGLSARIDQTVDVTIPTMKGVIVVWLTLSEAEQAEAFNKAVEDAYNQAMQMFAGAAKALVPAMANALATPALDPRTIVAWSDSLSAQADGIVAAIELGQQKRSELDQAMIEGKAVIDAATQRVNQAKLEHVLAAAQEATLEIAQSVPAA